MLYGLPTTGRVITFKKVALSFWYVIEGVMETKKHLNDFWKKCKFVGKEAFF